MPNVNYENIIVTDANIFDDSWRRDKRFVYMFTGTDCRNLPNGYTRNEGVLVYKHLYVNASANNHGMQYWFSMSDGKIWSRKYSNGWDSWRSHEGMNRPEDDTITLDANRVESSKIEKTSDLTNNLPNGITGDNKIGVLQTFITKDNNGVQFYTPAKGTHSNKLFIRNFTGTTFSTWNNVSQPNLEDYIKKPEVQPVNTNAGTVRQESSIRKTDSSTTNLPDGINGDNKKGILQVFKYTNNTMTLIFTPTYGSFKGRMYTRTVSDENQWTPWREIQTTKGILKPEDEPTISNAGDKTMKSGIYRTTSSTTNLPDINNKYGVLQHFKENGSTHTGFQMFMPIDGNGFGKIYFRAFKSDTNLNSSTWKVLDMHSLSDLSNNIFKHHSTTNNDVNTFNEAGYYHTCDETQHLPEGVDKNGILKLVIKNGMKHYTYTPLEGKHLGETYVAKIDRTKTLHNDLWERLQGNTTTILDQRGLGQEPPVNYKKHSHSGHSRKGYVVQEWKFATDVNLIGEENVTRCILTTHVPYDQANQTSNLEDIIQVATMYDNTMYMRHPQDENNWGTWTQIGAGGTGDSTDFSSWDQF